MPIKAIVIDDEEDARDILTRLLNRHGNIDIAGKAASAAEGFDLICRLQPDLIFLDVQMPGEDGFAVIERMRNQQITIPVIFVTAFAEFAIEAIRNAAFDYLLKPVNFMELQASLGRYFHAKQNNTTQNNIDQLLKLIGQKDKLCFNTRTGYIYVNPDDIIYCNADVNYTEIHISDGRCEVVTLNISKIAGMLENKGFFRISRSALINTQYLIKADRRSRTCELLKNDKRYTVAAPVKQIRELENKLMLSK